jgi:hypothetical protein
VIQPEDVDAFLLPLPEGRLPGVGKVTEEKLKGFEVHTIADLRRLDLPALETASVATASGFTNWRAVSTRVKWLLVGVGLSNFLDPEDVSAQPALFD